MEGGVGEGEESKLYSEIFIGANLSHSALHLSNFTATGNSKPRGLVRRSYLTPRDSRGTCGIKYDVTSNPGIFDA